MNNNHIDNNNVPTSTKGVLFGAWVPIFMMWHTLCDSNGGEFAFRNCRDSSDLAHALNPPTFHVVTATACISKNALLFVGG
eukprot:1625915-Rhodomonas_salina.1